MQIIRVCAVLVVLWHAPFAWTAPAGTPALTLAAHTLHVRAPTGARPLAYDIRNAAPCVIEARLSASGRVSHARLKWSSGARYLDEAALRAVRTARFSGVQASVRVQIPVQFRHASDS